MSSDRLMTAGIMPVQPEKRRAARMMHVAPFDATVRSTASTVSNKKIKIDSKQIPNASSVLYSWPDLSVTSQVSSQQHAPVTVSASSMPLLVIPPLSQASKFLFLNKKPTVSSSSIVVKQEPDQKWEAEKAILNRFLTLVFEEDTSGSVAKSLANQFSNFFVSSKNFEGDAPEDKEMNGSMQMKALAAPLNKAIVEIAKFNVPAGMAKRMLSRCINQLLVDMKAHEPERYLEIFCTILKGLILPKSASFHLVLTMMEYDHLSGAALLLPAMQNDVLPQNFAMLKMNYIKLHPAKTYAEISEHYADNLLQLLRSAGNYQDEGRNGKRNGAFQRVPDRMIEIGEEIFQYLISPANKKSTQDCTQLYVLANHYIERANEFNKAFKKEGVMTALFRPLNIYLRLMSLDNEGREYYMSAMNAYIEKSQLPQLSQTQSVAMPQRALLAVAQSMIKAESERQQPSLSFSR